MLLPGLLVAAAQPSEFDLQAHRGGRGETTEESLRAFATSLELGVSTLELDIVITKDDQPLVWHDAAIDADTAHAVGGDPQYPYVGKLVHDLTLTQIRTLDCGRPLPEYPCTTVVRGNKIATLPEVFALAESYRTPNGTGVQYNIETKVEANEPGASAGLQRFVDVILAAVRAAGTLDRVEIESFDWRTLPLVQPGRGGHPVGSPIRRHDLDAGLAVAGRH